MKFLNNYDNHKLDKLDILLESLLKDGIPLIFSERLYTLLKSINHPISRYMVNTQGDNNHKASFVDLDDESLESVSFIAHNKALQLIIDKEKQKITDDDLEGVTPYIINRLNIINTNLYNKLFKEYRTKTTIGRLVQKLYPNKFDSGGKPGEDIQSFTDAFKAARDDSGIEVVDGDNIKQYYYEGNYVEGSGTLHSSCMRYSDCEDYIDFYVKNDNIVKLVVMLEENEFGEEFVRGRALLWNLDSHPDRKFMDRIYYTEPYDAEIFKNYAIKNGWLYRKNQNSSSTALIVDPVNNTESYMTLYVRNMRNYDDVFPYMDTLKYYDTNDGTLSNDEKEMGNIYYELEDTEGGYEENQRGIWVEYYNDYYDEDDLIWCEWGDEYRLEEDAIYLEFYDTHATEEYIEKNLYECDYAEYSGWNAYRKYNDYVEIYGSGEYACTDYAEKNLTYSGYHDAYLPEGDEVYSDYHNDYIYSPESVSVYTNVDQSETDYRHDDDGSWWVWDHDGEKYDEDITEDELKEYHDLDDEDDE